MRLEGEAAPVSRPPHGSRRLASASLLTMRLRERRTAPQRHGRASRVEDARQRADDPAIHVFGAAIKVDVDARNECGHDVEREAPLSLRLILRSRAERGVSKDAAATVPQPPIFLLTRS